MNNSKLTKILCLLILLAIFSSCDSRYDDCMRYYIDEEDYFYDDAKDLCTEEMDDYHV